MTDGDLLDPKARRPRADEDLRIDERADRSDRNSLEHRAVEDLEGAVDVAHRQIEEHAYEPSPRRRDHAPQPRIAAGRAVPDHDLERPGMLEQMSDLGEIELEIGVAEEDELAAGGLESRAKSRAIAEILRMMHRAHPRIAPAPGFENDPALVGGPVVDDHDLEIESELLADRERAREQGRQVLGLVPGRKDEREGGSVHSRYPSARSRSATIASSSSS
jgi:hypothetical protein